MSTHPWFRQHRQQPFKELHLYLGPYHGPGPVRQNRIRIPRRVLGQVKRIPKALGDIPTQAMQKGEEPGIRRHLYFGNGSQEVPLPPHTAMTHIQPEPESAGPRVCSRRTTLFVSLGTEQPKAELRLGREEVLGSFQKQVGGLKNPWQAICSLSNGPQIQVFSSLK